jgi:hypothetical protein
MTSWNYRIVRKEEGQFMNYSIHEAYYNPDGSVKFLTAAPMDPWGETYDDLKETMHQMAEAFHKPVLDWDHAWDDK